MKKPLLALFIALSPICAFGQNFYFGGAIGVYSSLAGGQTLGDGSYMNGSANYINDSTVTYNTKSGSLGGGVKIDFEGGYMFNDNIGIGLNLNIGASSSSKAFTQSNVTVNSIASNVTFTNKASTPVLFTPKIILQAPISKGKIYTTFGLVMPLSCNFTTDASITNLPGAGAVETDVYHFDYTTSFALGLNAGLGYKKVFSERFNMFAQLEFTSLSVSVKEGVLSYITANGQYINMATQYPYPTHYYYSNSFTGNTQDDYHKPAYSNNFSNWGFKVGCQFNIIDRRSHRSEVETNGKSGGGAYKRKGNIKF